MFGYYLATATPEVHTVGINWASVLTIISSIVILITAVFGTFLRQQNRAIKSAVENQTVRLENTYATKDKMGELAARISYIEEVLADIRQHSRDHL